MTSVSDMSITGMRQSTTGFTLNLISNASMETYEQNTLARFTNLLPNVIELNKSMGTWQVALLEISWPSTIKNITDGRFETDACNGVDDSDDFSNGDFESMDEEEEEEAKVKQENNDELYSVIQKRQETLLGSGTISRDNHSSSLNWSRDDEEENASLNDYSESDEVSSYISYRLAQVRTGRYSSVDDPMSELCCKAFNTKEAGRWPLSWNIRKEDQRLEIHAAENFSKKTTSADSFFPPSS